MKYPEFFERVESITLKDLLAEFLGAFEEGIISFSYLDAVKSAGHSCPTIAGAYLMAREGLKALYKDEVPVRGEIKVFLKEGMEEGRAEGRAEGRVEGRAEGMNLRSLEIAKKMLAKGMDEATVMDVTGLTAEEMKLLKAKV